MNLLKLSYPELVRTTPEMFRACGFSVGQADDSAEMLLLTQVLFGGAYAYLLEHKGTTLNAALRPRIVQSDDGQYLIDGSGLSLLQIGQRLIDLACGTAFHAGCTFMIVHGTDGDLFAPYLVRRAALRGYRAVIKFVGVDENRSVVAIPRPDSLRPVVCANPESAADGWNAAVSSLATRLNHFNSLHADATGRHTGVAIAVERVVAGEKDRTLRMENPDGADGAQVFDFDVALQKAIQHGMTMDALTFSRLGELLVSLRVPTSERSRLQAG